MAKLRDLVVPYIETGFFLQPEGTDKYASIQVFILNKEGNGLHIYDFRDIPEKIIDVRFFCMGRSHQTIAVARTEEDLVRIFPKIWEKLKSLLDNT